MKRKTVYSIAIVISFCLLTGFNNSISTVDGEDFSSRGRVDCYSTWLQGTDYMIYDCGPCTHVTCDDYSDHGRCRYKPE